MTIQGGTGTPVELSWIFQLLGGGILNYGTVELKDSIISGTPQETVAGFSTTTAS